jgi:hypothetical protein
MRNEANREVLHQILKDNGISVPGILRKFSIDMLSDGSYFILLLFYMGLLTVDAPYRLQLMFSV